MVQFVFVKFLAVVDRSSVGFFKRVFSFGSEYLHHRKGSTEVTRRCRFDANGVVWSVLHVLSGWLAYTFPHR
jgi:hypothetical protein